LLTNTYLTFLKYRSQWNSSLL